MDFSPSGVADLPQTTADSLQRGDPRVLGWIKEAVDEGDRINRQDPSYDQIEPALRYIVGEQLTPEHRKLKYLPQVVINESRKAIQAHVSALTDLKPLGGWKSTVHKQQADLLNLYNLAEWVSTLADVELGECVKYSLAAGTGDFVIDWDPHAPGGGQHEYSARDPRDTLPIRPSQARSLQLWQGIILREEHSVNALRGKYPDKAYLFKPSSDTAVNRVIGRFRTLASRLLTPADPLDMLGQQSVHTRRSRSGAVVLYRTHVRDHTRNLTTKDMLMGQPGSNWAYPVRPGEPLYPRGRMIVCTEDAIIFDGPNPYWHGMFPVCRLRLWSVPWQFLGIPLFNDLLPVQDAINKTVHDVRLGIEQWMDPDLTYNRNAVSEMTMRTLDPRKPGKKLKVNPGFGEPYKKENGPNPTIIQQAIELWQLLTTKHNDLSGTANLTALLQLRQMPSADTIAKYFEALTPEIRQEARQIEAFIRDMAQMQKVNYFQFVSQDKLEKMLGTIGVSLKAFNPDGTGPQFVPAMTPGDPGYVRELDAELTSPDQRAQYFHQLFTFVAAPNSILGLHAQEHKMMRFQLARMGYYDFWSLHETLETPNVGSPPAIPLPPLEPIPKEAQEGMLLQLQANFAMGLPPSPYIDPTSGKQYLLDPMSGQVLEIRVPFTVTERLQAQQMLGIGMTENPAGRKASGDAPPKSETKSDGRQTVTESDK